MLKMTGIELELISSIDKHLFIEKGMRGGISHIAKRYSKANNNYMKDYNSCEESIYIIYLDANNLHGLVMCQYLPCGGFKWLNQKETDKFDVNSINENSSDGWMKIYIDFNTEKRKNATNSFFFFKFFKQMINSFYGKTIENLIS